jgi:hypothetical protein
MSKRTFEVGLAVTPKRRDQTARWFPPQDTPLSSGRQELRPGWRDSSSRPRVADLAVILSFQSIGINGRTASDAIWPGWAETVEEK